MKQLTCEMCGSTDLMKQEGAFVCQSCGCKYSVEEAKKMMIEGTVETRETTKVGSDNELNNLYELARRAKSECNYENAHKYYEMAMLKDPSSWEATFYSVYYKSINCRIADIETAAKNVAGVVKTSLKLVKDNITDVEEKCSAISEISEKSMSIKEKLGRAAYNHYNNIDYSIRNDYSTEYVLRNNAVVRIEFALRDGLVNQFSSDKDVFPKACIPILKKHFKFDSEVIEAIKQYEPDYNPKAEWEKTTTNSQNTTQTNNQSAGGCYVATAVYGSYDCPQVWTLRRYRDYTLAETWHGRAFIKTYYAISPTLVKWFGHTEWFKKMWQGKLDRMVARLQANGVESTPYEDRNW